MRLHARSLGAIAAMHVVVALPAHAQRFLDTLSASAYARAERFMQHRAADKMYRSRVDVRWLSDGSRFWYSVDTPEGAERYVVDPARNTKQLLVDRAGLARGISTALDSVVESRRLTLSEFELSKDEKQVSFNVGKKGFSCEIASYKCSVTSAKPRPDRGMRRSPDEKWDAFVRDNDIYVRQVGCTTGVSCETRLTTDGSADWAYGRAGTFQSISLKRTGAVVSGCSRSYFFSSCIPLVGPLPFFRTQQVISVVPHFLQTWTTSSLVALPTPLVWIVV